MELAKIRRHDWLYLHQSPKFSEAINLWVRNFPVVVARSPEILVNKINVGICFDQHKNTKSRFGFVIDADAIKSQRSPLRLSELTSSIAKENLAGLNRLFILNNINPFVYGSYAWQEMTGKDFVNKSSDLDLLINVKDMDSLSILQDMLTKASDLSPIKLDVELCFANKYYVNYQELFSNNNEILIKSLTEVKLVNTVEFLKDYIY